jgi:hypothetical protein
LSQASGGLKLLLIDNIAAFYWLDRAARPLPGYLIDTTMDMQMSLQHAHSCIAAELQILMREHRLAVIATKHSIFSSSGNAFDR